MNHIATVLLIVLASSAQAQSIQERLNRVFDDLNVKPNWPGVAVLVRQDGKTLYQSTAGIRDLRNRARITSRTNFRLASCTKQFTAMSIMLLVHDGKLQYDDPLTKVFPDFPAYGNKITIRNLLNHTSGLPDYEDLMDLPENKQNHWTADHQISDAEVLALLKKQSLGKFEPGTSWSYSNSGYVVLGTILAKVSGMSFPEFLKKRIFAPLGMKSTVAYVRRMNNVASRACGHSRSEAKSARRAQRLAAGSMPGSPTASLLGWTETDQSSTSATLGDGGVYSNLEDLAKWDDALAHHTLLGAEEMRPALRPFTLPGQGESAERLPKWEGDSGDEDPQHGKPVAYGFGWFLDPYVDSRGTSHPRMWHYGDTRGFKSAIMRFDSGVTIIVLCNRTDVDPGEVATRFADVYYAAR